MASGIRLKYEDVKAFFESQGCELLENEYVNARTHLSYRCSCGNISKIVFDSFRKGNRCSKCGSEKIRKFFTLTQDEAEQAFAEHGCELMDTYVHSRTPMVFLCSCGKIKKISLNNFKKRHHCGECGLKQRSGENHYEWYADREALKLRYSFKDRCYKLISLVLKVTGRVKNKRSAELLGYDYKQLQEHIQNHPNWEKVKDGKWHIDHIFPIKAFLDHGISDLKLVNALDNLRPLEASENHHKNAKYDKQQFIEYLKTKGIILNETPSNGT
jgi:hypothetical protein